MQLCKQSQQLAFLIAGTFQVCNMCIGMQHALAADTHVHIQPCSRACSGCGQHNTMHIVMHFGHPNMSAQSLRPCLLYSGVFALQQDTTGLGVILLTHLTEEQWVEEDDMARRLNLPNKMVRKALRYLEQVSWRVVRECTTTVMFSGS